MTPIGRVLVACAVIAAAVSAARAAGTVEVSASLDLTDGFARVGGYVPLRLRIVNHTGDRITDLCLGAGGPVAVTAPLDLAPGDERETVLPFWFAGGAAAPAVDFYASGRPVARTEVRPLPVRKLGDAEVLVAVPSAGSTPERAEAEALARTLGAETVHFVSAAPDTLAILRRFGAIDAQIAEDLADVDTGGLVIACGSDGAWTLSRPPFPRGVASATQPETYRLLLSEPWPAAERVRLWLWLGLATLAVPAVGLWISRRRAVWAALVLVGLAGAALVLIDTFGDLSRTRTTVARFLYAVADRPAMAVEHLELLESRGGAVGRLTCPASDRRPLPVPVLASASDLFRPLGALRLGRSPFDAAVFEAARDGVLLRLLTEEPRAEEPPSPIRSLRIMGRTACDAAGTKQPLTAWVAAWSAAADPETAYLGRSLAWWMTQRREGGGPVRLVWFHERVDGPREMGRTELRRPSLWVASEPEIAAAPD